MFVSGPSMGSSAVKKTRATAGVARNFTEAPNLGGYTLHLAPTTDVETNAYSCSQTQAIIPWGVGIQRQPFHICIGSASHLTILLGGASVEEVRQYHFVWLKRPILSTKSTAAGFINYVLHRTAFGTPPIATKINGSFGIIDRLRVA